MIAFPIFERLDVTDYALFPGSDSGDPGLHLRFHRGLTVVIGANGLGKTTLVTLLYRMFTGPYDIPALASRLVLGNADLQPKSLSTTTRDQFRTRVADGAKDAVATLFFRLGASEFTVTRRLRDLSLQSFETENATLDTEERYQAQMVASMGLGAFSDVILILRHIMFLFEDRRTLVWDPGAQKQLLRILFLSADVSREWTRLEREILELDSQTRNLRAVISSQQKELSKDEAVAENVADVRAELKLIEEFRDRDVDSRNELLDQRDRADELRKQARLRSAQDEAEFDSKLRELEHAGLSAVAARFPSSSQSALYLLTQLMADGSCRLCGQSVPAVAAQLNERVGRNHCLVCNSAIEKTTRGKHTISLADRRLELLRTSVREINAELTKSRAELSAIEDQYAMIEQELQELDLTMAIHDQKINRLIERLPPDERDGHDRRTQLYAMRAVERESFNRLEQLRAHFASFVQRVSLQINKRSSEIAKSFDRYARDFLAETCRLRWAPQQSQIGQSGDRIEFPAFQLELSGADFPLPVRRLGPEQVSESQREFIDLAFRMALIEVAGGKKGASLVIDAPESSLDTVFTQRAAYVLGKFARARSSNRLVVTSNLVEGTLIPKLVAEVASNNRDDRLVNLLREATPTAAVQQHISEYRSAYRRLTKASRLENSKSNALTQSKRTR